MADEKTRKNGERLHGAGLRRTPQRLAVLECVQRAAGHPTAEQIGADLNRRFPRASRATVYNALRALRDAGLVSELRLADGAAARYEAKLDRHHHFLCRRCGRLEDVSREAVGAPALGALGGDFVVEDYEIVLRGLCAACGKKVNKR
jgi:Fur family peroxide stress response transcriptional regulator